jgi:predicted Zn-dependent peptidase
MRKALVCILLLAFLIPFAYGTGFSDRAKQFTLANGMTFYVYERHQIPTFCGMIMAKVGSVDERKGETGLAHFFEHLAFKGTPVIGTNDYAKEKAILEQIDKLGEERSAEYAKGEKADTQKMAALKEQMKTLQDDALKYAVKDELGKIYSENGGRGLNASTGRDTTQYFITLPANRLELWFLIESERFKYPAFREFYSERDVIAEERRMSENMPGSNLYEEFENAAFTLHPYRHSVVGYMEDIQTFTRPKAMSFYKLFYIPNNLTAAVVGDVRLEDVKLLAEKYFGDIPRGSDSPRPDFLEPKQKGERRVTTEFDAQPELLIGYHMPQTPDKDAYTLEMIGDVLSLGDSSRLTRDLVTNRKLALSIYASAGTGQRYAGLFMVSGEPRSPNSAEDLEKAVYEHLEKLKSEPVKKEELEKVINQLEAQLFSGFSSNMFIAMRMLWGAVIDGDIDTEFTRVDALKKVTPEDIMDVAKRTFVFDNRTVGILKKKGGSK